MKILKHNEFHFQDMTKALAFKLISNAEFKVFKSLACALSDTEFFMACYPTLQKLTTCSVFRESVARKIN